MSTYQTGIEGFAMRKPLRTLKMVVAMLVSTSATSAVADSAAIATPSITVNKM